MSNGRQPGRGPGGREPRPAASGGGGGRREEGSATPDRAALGERLRDAPLFVDTGHETHPRAPNPQLFEEIAKPFAERIRREGLRDTTQLRRWFNAVDELNSRAMRDALTDEHIRAEMALLRARIAYASKRPGVRVPAALVDLVVEGARKVTTPEDLYVFRCLLECVVAYHRAGS